MLLIIFQSGSAAPSEPDRTLAEQLEKQLKELTVEPADREEIARRFGLLSGELPEIPAPPEWQLHMQRDFWVINTTRRATVAVPAEIIYIGDHLVVWIESAVKSPISQEYFDEFRLFDQEYYPQIRETFGSEESPGIDHDPKIHVLFTKAAGIGILGYFSSRDVDHPAISPHSNAMEMFIMDAGILNQHPKQITNTLAHEFQHMIHFAHDANEESNLDEGFSGFAEYLIQNRISNVYESSFLKNPDISISQWPIDASGIPYYGAAFLFTKYLTDRLGEAFLKKIIIEPANGLDGLEDALFQAGQPSADQLYTEWIAANLLNALGHPAGNYRYIDYQPPMPSNQANVTTLPMKDQILTAEAMQYGTDFYQLKCPSGFYQIEIEGSATVPVVSLTEGAQLPAWWTNSVSNSSTSLERSFDFTEITEPITLQFSINYDLEEDYDFLYLLVSDDGGDSWQLLNSAYGTNVNHSGFNLGWGWTGSSQGWLTESVDLSAYGGKEILMRFEYITDQALTGEGALLDDLRIDAIAFHDDGSALAEDWESDGFIRLTGDLLQKFAVVVVKDQPEVVNAEIDTFSGGTPYTINCDFDKFPDAACAFGISPINRRAHGLAAYQIQVIKTNR